MNTYVCIFLHGISVWVEGSFNVAFIELMHGNKPSITWLIAFMTLLLNFDWNSIYSGHQK